MPSVDSDQALQVRQTSQHMKTVFDQIFRQVGNIRNRDDGQARSHGRTNPVR